MLMTGYNLVRGRAVDEFREAAGRRYGLRQPETLSVIALLRHLERRQVFPHRVVQITGLLPCGASARTARAWPGCSLTSSFDA
jgi:hypothetical protein